MEEASNVSHFTSFYFVFKLSKDQENRFAILPKYQFFPLTFPLCVHPLSSLHWPLLVSSGRHFTSQDPFSLPLWGRVIAELTPRGRCSYSGDQSCGERQFLCKCGWRANREGRRNKVLMESSFVMICCLPEFCLINIVFLRIPCFINNT